MKIVAINGGPRKKWNTATLLENALEGAASQGATTELVHLYDLSYTGCISCFACKKRGGESYGQCAVQDDLQGVLEEIESSDGFLLGSPVYFGIVTGQMRSFMERLMFPFRMYTQPPRSLFPKRIKTGFVYTMNVKEQEMIDLGYDVHFRQNRALLKAIFGCSEYFACCDTLQFEDYSKYVAERYDADEKARKHKEVFPGDCEKAFQMGRRLTQPYQEQAD